MMLLEIATPLAAFAIRVLVELTGDILPHPAKLQDCVIETAEICA